MEVDRVACFHDAVLGYSSVLYGLKNDSDFKDFEAVVTQLWKALKNDKKLPVKLVSLLASCYHCTVTDFSTTN